MLALAAFAHLGHGDHRVVVGDAPGHTAEEGERAQVAILKSLCGLAGIGLHEKRVGVGQRHHKQRGFDRLAVNDDVRVPEVNLSLAGPMRQRHEDFLLLEFQISQEILDDGVAALVAALFAQAVKDALACVALFLVDGFVRFEPRADDVDEGRQFDPRPLFGHAVTGHVRVAQDLVERLPVNAVDALNRALGLAVDQDASANVGPFVHVSEHLQPPSPALAARRHLPPRTTAQRGCLSRGAALFDRPFASPPPAALFDRPLQSARPTRERA